MTATTERSDVRTTLMRVVAWLVAAGILAQAVLAGQGLFVDGALFGLHGGIGHGVLLLSVVLVALVLLTGTTRTTLVLAVLLVLGLIGQTGLGYAGRRSGIAFASSLHVPLGVTLLGVSVAIAVLVGPRPRA
ncbi:DUF6220 domain-containing protein [Egicoccus sp. AB-alg6-2]|uniref:DUF6220 domain-containing protein n=1 Tax=Egicoccus sp. AB-alg6-2 TaxID=3242692 RepID=UPI00359F05C9